MRTSVRLVIATAAAATAATGGLAAPAGAGTPAVGSAGGHLASVVHAGTRFAATQSSNWFGYSRGMLDKKKRFTSIEGTWVVPTAHQHTRGDSGEASATWIGIGGGCLDSGCGTGAQDETLIQAGTEQDVAANGTASYNAWWEIIPEPETRIALPVRPGDTVHVLIKEKSAGQWFIEIDNRTTGKKFTKSQAYPGLGGSAEWIEETPLQLGTNAGLSALPDLTTVPFTGAKANGNNANLNSSQAMDLIDANGNVIGVPSAPNATHDGFHACAWATTCS